jgi:hypothetical protein
MSSTTYDWFTVDDHDDLTGDGMVSVGNVLANSGRNGRSADIELATPNNTSAVIVVEQDGADEMVELDHFEDSNGNNLSALPAAGGIIYLVGYANCNYLSAEDLSEKICTDINETNGMLHQGGFILVENDGNGTMHVGIPINTSITPDYGATNGYEFKMPFYLAQNDTPATIPINIEVSNQGETVTDDISVNQSGV